LTTGSRTKRSVVAAALATCVGLALVAGCTRVRVGSTPDFARQPFAPFSRSAAVEIALREWRLFGERELTVERSGFR